MRALAVAVVSNIPALSLVLLTFLGRFPPSYASGDLGPGMVVTSQPAPLMSSYGAGLNSPKARQRFAGTHVNCSLMVGRGAGYALRQGVGDVFIGGTGTHVTRASRLLLIRLSGNRRLACSLVTGACRVSSTARPFTDRDAAAIASTPAPPVKEIP